MIYKRTCPHQAECSAIFDQELHDSYAPPSLFTQSCSERLFCLFVFPVKKLLEGKYFAYVEELKPKTADTLQGIQTEQFKNYLSSGKNISVGVLTKSNGEYLEGD